ncbi:MAG: DNA replication and repair protein RecF [bacterium]
MRLERLELDSFRSYKKQTFHFGDLTVLVGPNASGKTNVLEAIYLLSTGVSHKAGVTEEMITFGREIAHVTGIVEHNGERVSLGVGLTKGLLLGKRTQKRRYLVDGAPRTKARFLGRMPVVFFRPEDLRLIEGSPGRRRGLMDEVLMQASSSYARAHVAYEGAIRRRNKILDAIREGTARREQLSFWDQTAIKNGNILTDARRGLLEYLSEREVSFGKYKLQYEASTISESRLKEYEQQEVAAGYTLVGPHKDDLIVFMATEKTDKEETGTSWRDLMKYGSRGEQRLAVLFIKLGVLQYLEEKLEVKPILLLDDIFSELDEQHRREVLKMTEGRQTIITTAEEEVAEMLKGAETIRVGK